MHNIQAIRSEADYDQALAEIAIYFDNQPETGSEEAGRFNLLADLIEAYEANHWAIRVGYSPSTPPFVPITSA